MSQKIQLRRGTTSEIGSTIFDQGEPAWVTNERKLYIGDGATIKGQEVAMIASGNPISITSPGVSGQFKIVSSFLYISTGNNQWGRIAISSF